MKLETQMTGNGDPVVLMPGGLTGWISWISHAEVLAKHYRVVRAQLLGVALGLENKPLPKDYGVRYESRALAEALEGLSLAPFHLVGWSFGAEVSLDYALNHPERIRTLTLIEPPAIWVLRTKEPLSQALLDEQKTIAKLGPGDVSEDQLAWFSHFAGFVPKDVDPRALPQWPVWVKHRQSLRTGDAAFRHDDSAKRLSAFARPTLLVKGTGSAPFLHDIIGALAEMLPTNRVVELPGGHAPQLAAKDDFLKILTGFLAESSL